MQKLINGYVRFRAHAFPKARGLYEKLGAGQKPRFMVITCADSRVDPHGFTSSRPGDMFMERSLGNVVPLPGRGETEANSTIEYAVRALNVEHIIVCGHTQCGAMKAILDPDSVIAMPLVAAWLGGSGITRELIERKHPGLEGEALLDATIKENVLIQVDHVRRQPSVEARLAEGKLQVHGWIFEVEHGRVIAYDPRVDRFVPLIDAYAKSPPDGLTRVGGTMARDASFPWRSIFRRPS